MALFGVGFGLQMALFGVGFGMCAAPHTTVAGNV
jgi:hypothetical protein